VGSAQAAASGSDGVPNGSYFALLEQLEEAGTNPRSTENGSNSKTPAKPPTMKEINKDGPTPRQPTRLCGSSVYAFGSKWLPKEARRRKPGPSTGRPHAGTSQGGLGTGGWAAGRVARLLQARGQPHSYSAASIPLPQTPVGRGTPSASGQRTWRNQTAFRIASGGGRGHAVCHEHSGAGDRMGRGGLDAKTVSSTNSNGPGGELAGWALLRAG
jgi:hypothetical protein